MANRLAQSSSSYLRSAAHQPIDWYEFGPEAFAAAKAQDKPVLLDIGAVWCHWCHVIDRESYEDPSIADFINQHYIAVKVDRDQRPDIDSRYQKAISSISGQGGWPLTGFLTHDGRVIYGGTYFPPQAMKQLLSQIKDVYHEKKQEIYSNEAEFSAEAIRQMEAEQASTVPGQYPELSNVLLASIENTCTRAFDAEQGGFGSRPKFPHYSTLTLLLAMEHESPQPERRKMIEKTLIGMALGGVYDQIGDGFHRYSTDERWHVPHFEKMAYDNAEALTVYTHAYRLTGNPFFRQVAEGIIAWVSRDMADTDNGGFYASQDADISLDDDGDHFTWTLDEVRALLTQDEAEAVTAYYGLDREGDMHERPGRNVLQVIASADTVAKQMSRSVNEIANLLGSAQQKMLNERQTNRPIPFIDETLYLNWNGMMISSFVEAADLLNLPEARNLAIKTTHRMLDDLYTPGEGVYHTTGIHGTLDDYAQFALGLTKAYGSTGEPRFIHAAEDIASMVLKRFEDTIAGGFYDIAEDAKDAIGLLKIRNKPMEDTPSSSANGVMLQVLRTLYAITGTELYKEKFLWHARRLAFQAEGHGMYVSALGLAIHQWLNPPMKLELVGQNGLEFERLLAAARSLFYPGKTVSFAQSTDANAPAECRVCVGTQCYPPLQRGDDLARFRPQFGPAKVLVQSTVS